MLPSDGRQFKDNFLNKLNKSRVDKIQDKTFEECFRKAGKAWDVALKMAVLHKGAGLSQKEPARRAGMTQQQISRLESPAYEGHSPSMLRRVADVLGTTVHVELRVRTPRKRREVAEPQKAYEPK